MLKWLPILIIYLLVFSLNTQAQTCSLPGMTPDNAIPVCGTAVFHQSKIDNCTGTDVAHQGCPEAVTSSSSFWYKFTCFKTGTLGFLISGLICSDDYDWELFDITGHNPSDVFSNSALQVSLNIYGTLGCGGGGIPPNSPTGCTASGSGNIHCEGDAAGNSPFNAMPTITQGHQYLLMVTNWTKSTSGYDLSFNGGSASITDTLTPHLLKSRAACDGTQATININKQMLCNSLSADGSEFFITPNLANVIAATGYGCSNSFNMDSIILTLDKALPPGNYIISIKNGSDGNTLSDICGAFVAAGENIPMVIYPVFPTAMDSLDKVYCAPTELVVDFSAKLRQIRCSSIAADGSDFVVNKISGIGAAVIVASATGVCNANGITPIIKVKLSTPIETKGVYQIVLKTGSDGNTIINECGQQTPAGATLTFFTVDTVNANFNYNVKLGCKVDTINYFHDGNNFVNYWKWIFNNRDINNLQNPSLYYGIFGNKTAQLIVSNGVCTDTSAIVNILLDNYFKAQFEASAFACPGDPASFKDTSIGNIIAWHWDFGNSNTSLLQQPPQQIYTYTNITRNIPVQLIITANSGCKDTAYQNILIPSNCYIAVPNAFTPNGDGLNDYLYPLNAYKAKELIFKVYNRFGQMVFYTTDWTKKWDGTFNGVPADMATYVWILQYTNIDTGQRIEQKGTTILIR